MRKLITLIYVLLTVSPAFATPVISGAPSGTIAHGQNITIPGSGFLTKSPASPILWAPFDSDINPSSLGRLTTWAGTGGAGCEVWANNTGTIGGGVSTNPTTCENTSSFPMALIADTTPLGIQLNALGARFYAYRSRYLTDFPSDGTNIKSWMFWTGTYGGGEIIYSMAADETWNGQNMSPGSSYYNNVYVQDHLNSWSNEEVIAQVAGSVNQNAARFDFVVNGVETTVATRTLAMNSGNNIHQANLAMHEHFSSSGAQELEHFDNLYLDNTWSRVMIGNASTLAASTHREIQVPTSWADGSITVNVNRGTFGATDSAYLYVVDSAGVVNTSGYPITFGSGTAPQHAISRGAKVTGGVVR